MTAEFRPLTPAEIRVIEGGRGKPVRAYVYLDSQNERFSSREREPYQASAFLGLADGLLGDSLPRVLEERGIEVRGRAINMQNFLKEINGSRSDVAIIDTLLPGYNAFELPRLMSERAPDIKTIMLGSSFGLQELQLFKNQGIEGAVLKGDTLEDLTQTIVAVKRGGIHMSPRVTKLIKDVYGFVRAQPDKFAANISEREIEVLRLMALGYGNTEIAERLVLSIKTVESHKAHIKTKLGVNSLQASLRFAISTGLIGLDEIGSEGNGRNNM